MILNASLIIYILEYTSLIHVTAFGIPPALWPLAYRPKAGVV